MVDDLAASTLTPVDSGYWVLLFTPAAHRTSLRAVLEWQGELQRGVDRSSDPGVTRVKLDWWRQELNNITASRHPLARPLAPLATTQAGNQALQQLLDAAETQVRCQQPADIADFHAQCQQGGALARLLVMTENLGAVSDEHASEADTLGIYADAVWRVQQLGRRLQRDHRLLPASLLPDGHPADWHAGVLADSCEQLLCPLEKAARPLLGERNRTLAPARRWAAQARAVHRLLRREGYPVHQKHLDITPLARLWAAWRVR